MTTTPEQLTSFQGSYVSRSSIFTTTLRSFEGLGQTNLSGVDTDVFSISPYSSSKKPLLFIVLPRVSPQNVGRYLTIPTATLFMDTNLFEGRYITINEN